MNFTFSQAGNADKISCEKEDPFPLSEREKPENLSLSLLLTQELSAAHALPQQTNKLDSSSAEEGKSSEPQKDSLFGKHAEVIGRNRSVS